MTTQTTNEILEKANRRLANVMAREVFNDLCADEDVWATHGIPGDNKAVKIKERIARAIEEALNV